MPGKFLFDNGGEFNNPEMIDLAEKNAIPVAAVTAAHSPFSNGLCEKNHAVVDFMMAKMMSDDPTLKEQDALDFTLHAKNIETPSKGFSSFQIFYGSNPHIPGIIEGNPASLNDSYKSVEVKQHLDRINKAPIAFRQADTDERIKRALRAKVAASNDIFVENGELIFLRR